MALLHRIYDPIRTPNEEDWYGEEKPDQIKDIESPPDVKILALARSVYQYEKTWRPVIDEELERTFQELKERWKNETRFLSSTTEIIHNANYQYIIGLGPNVISLLLRDLGETQEFWFWALMAISRENPVPEDDMGNIERMVEGWLEWGHRKGYL